MKIKYPVTLALLLLYTIPGLLAQHTLIKTSHHLLGVDVEGAEIELPFSKTETEIAWKDYAKSFGRSEATQGHQAYETVFKQEIYSNKILVFTEIKGNTKSGKIWAGIDPQGIPKDIYPKLQMEMQTYLHDFNIKMRKDAAQKEIEESERAASFLSKSYEELKREERKNVRSQEKNHQKIKEYELELKQMRQDSINYNHTLEALNIKLDSVYLEIEKVKKMVDLYKVKLEEIK
ncbi:hypothetical protein JKA74_10865 [Marivirga sp. S37H4]|uniref:Uncharacterized protein n=1 Tax=Marivirga aurantiaca TaxID=2802615 RepID=A0A935C8N2_9BACT|nr:hypothetical protein [Marivirga aurantiaca]MBK6265539.1 hypothetical protein [Marivirga aurantiaca]